MGTNFYLKRKLTKEKSEELKTLIDNFEYEKVKEILEKVKPIHIGKRSCGWRFIWDAHYFKYFEPNTESIENFLRSGTIVDECNNEFTYKDFMENEVGETLTEGYDLIKWYAEHPNDYRRTIDYNHNDDLIKITRSINRHAVNKYGEFTIGDRLFIINEDFA